MIKALRFLVFVFVAMLLLSAGCSKKVMNPIDSSSDAVQPQDEQMQGFSLDSSQDAQGTTDTTVEPAEFGDKMIHFDYDKFNIRPEDAQILEELADFLNLHNYLKVEIQGHCDERGTSEYNMSLGDRRARAAQTYLISLGIDSQRITTNSYGEEKPLMAGHSEEDWAKNRRGQFVFSARL